MKTIKLLAENAYDADVVSRETALFCKDASLTKQSFKDECDINTIVRNFGLTGELPDDVRAPSYGDYTDVCDYHTALNAIALANEAFDRMPATVRARFNNDPGAFVDFCSSADNIDEMRKMGLLESANVEPAAPVVAEPVIAS